MTRLSSSRGRHRPAAVKWAASATALAVVSLFAAGLALVPAAATPSGGNAPAAGRCESSPAATDGQLTLDRDSVRPGQSALGVLTGFRQWPQALIGGESGATFVTCSPWESATARPEVLAHDASAFYLVHVPVGAAEGWHTVGVRFYQGSTGPMDFTEKVVLTARILVVSQPAFDMSRVSPACGLTHAAATVGSLDVADTVHPGENLTVRISGATSWLNEPDRIYYIACLWGPATVITAMGGPPSVFTMPVLTGVRPGGYMLSVTGVGRGGTAREPTGVVLSWRHPVVITTRAQTQPPSATVSPGQTGSPTTPPLAVTGTGPDPWPIGAVGVALLFAGGGVLATTRRRGSRA